MSASQLRQKDVLTIPSAAKLVTSLARALRVAPTLASRVATVAAMAVAEVAMVVAKVLHATHAGKEPSRRDRSIPC